MNKTTLQQRIQAFTKLGEYISEHNEALEKQIYMAISGNSWFTKENVLNALHAWEMSLSADELNTWLSKYPKLNENLKSKRIGLILAGNIPMVGFHDILSVIISGHKAIIKTSSKDALLIPHLLKKLIESEPDIAEQIEFVERLTNTEAIIATGSDNSSRYFEYYFGKQPHIIRKNRNSVAILNGTETKQDFEALGKDIFTYFGLGCRNVSKLFVPENYDFVPFFEGIESYSPIMDHHKYSNNHSYNLTLLMMNKVKHYDNGFLMLNEHPNFASPMASLHYEYYTDTKTLEQHFHADKDKVQCIASKDAWFANSIAFGCTQMPQLWDYADRVDTVEFLSGLVDE